MPTELSPDIQRLLAATAGRAYAKGLAAATPPPAAVPPAAPSVFEQLMALMLLKSMPAAAIEATPLPAYAPAAVFKAFDESKHPRSDNGHFVSGDHIADAAGDPAAEAKLRETTTKPAELKKLNTALDTAAKAKGDTPTAADEAGKGTPAPQHPQLAKTLAEHEDKIRHGTREAGYVIDRSGKVVSEDHQAGDATELVLSPEEEKAARGNILTHNHPKGDAPSVGDYQQAIRLDLHQLRAATPDGVHIIDRPAGGWPKDADFTPTSPMLRDAGLEAKAATDEAVAKGEVNGTPRRHFSGELSRSIAEKLGVQHRFEPAGAAPTPAVTPPVAAQPATVPAAPTATAKAPKPTARPLVADTLATIRGHLGTTDTSLHGPGTADKIAAAIGNHTHAELAEIRKELGIKASGNKADVIAKMAARATQGKHNRSDRSKFVNERMTADEAHDALKAHLDAPEIDHDALAKLGTRMAEGLSVKELGEVKKRLGLRAGGGKQAMVDKLVKRAVSADAARKTAAAAEPAGHEPPNLSTTTAAEAAALLPGTRLHNGDHVTAVKTRTEMHTAGHPTDPASLDAVRVPYKVATVHTNNALGQVSKRVVTGKHDAEDAAKAEWAKRLAPAPVAAVEPEPAAVEPAAEPVAAQAAQAAPAAAAEPEPIAAEPGQGNAPADAPNLTPGQTPAATAKPAGKPAHEFSRDGLRRSREAAVKKASDARDFPYNTIQTMFGPMPPNLKQIAGRLRSDDVRGSKRQQLSDQLSQGIEDHYGPNKSRQIAGVLNKLDDRYHSAHERLATTDTDHRAAVDAALAAGKPVPPEVLADYPDLKPPAAALVAPAPAMPPAPVTPPAAPALSPKLNAAEARPKAPTPTHVATLADGSPVAFTPHPKQAAHETTVAVHPAALDAGFAKSPNEYIPPGGGGPSSVPGRRENFEAFLKTGASVQASRASLDPATGAVDFADGRHRFSVLRDRGADKVAVTVPKDQAAEFSRRFGQAPAAPKSPTGVDVSPSGDKIPGVGSQSAAPEPGEKTMELPTLQGSEKQVAWAEGLRAKVLAATPPHVRGELARVGSAKHWIDNKGHTDWQSHLGHARGADKADIAVVPPADFRPAKDRERAAGALAADRVADDLGFPPAVAEWAKKAAGLLLDRPVREKSDRPGSLVGGMPNPHTWTAEGREGNYLVKLVQLIDDGYGKGPEFDAARKTIAAKLGGATPAPAAPTAPATPAAPQPAAPEPGEKTMGIDLNSHPAAPAKVEFEYHPGKGRPPVKASGREGDKFVTLDGSRHELSSPLLAQHSVGEDAGGVYVKTQMQVASNRDKQGLFSAGFEDFPATKTLIVNPDGTPTADLPRVVAELKHGLARNSHGNANASSKLALRTLQDDLRVVTGVK